MLLCVFHYIQRKKHGNIYINKYYVGLNVCLKEQVKISQGPA